MYNVFTVYAKMIVQTCVHVNISFSVCAYFFLFPCFSCTLTKLNNILLFTVQCFIQTGTYRYILAHFCLYHTNDLFQWQYITSLLFHVKAKFTHHMKDYIYCL